MQWIYGEMMLEQGDIESLDEWSDDKEYCCSIMDQRLDYLWDFSNGIHFIDRLYSDRELNPDAWIDDTTKHRIEIGEAELWFDNFDKVKKFIAKKEV